MLKHAKQTRNEWLDTLRGIAASWVVLFHFEMVLPSEPTLYSIILRLGYLGVPIFFVVSGYCIWATAKRTNSLWHFCWRRLCRIYPPYLVSLLVVVVTCIIRKFITGTNDVTKLPSTFYEWLTTLTITTAPVTDVETINWVYWSLSYEIFFYLIIAITLIYRKFQLALLYLLLMASMIPSLSTPNSLTFFLDHWGLFVFGIGVYSLLFERQISSYFLILLSISSIAINNSASILLITCLTGLTIFISERYNSLLNRKNVLTHVGKISYGLYLLHVPIGCYLLLRFRQGKWLEILPLHILYDLTALIICIGCAFVFFKWVEQPSILLGQQKILWQRVKGS